MAIMPFPEIDPIAFSLGPLSIHWYGLAYVAGIMLGWYYARQIAGNNKLWPGDVSPITKVQLDDFIIWVALGIVLGGRIGYILFYDMPAVIESPIRAIQIWNGHVLPRRPDGHHHRDDRLRAAQQHTDLEPVRYCRSSRPDRPVLRPRRQLHQW